MEDETPRIGEATPPTFSENGRPPEPDTGAAALEALEQLEERSARLYLDYERRLARVELDARSLTRTLLLSNVSIVLYGVAALLIIRRVVKLEGIVGDLIDAAP